jgi:glycosyltransferase involved in cell wall biosynthesis
MPLVSVLLPVYNSIQDLPRAIHSLRIQTFDDFEVIAIDDGSTDKSGQVLDEYAHSDARIRVFHQANAGNLGTVLNKAAELARGKYFARQDSDDASAVTRLEEQVQYLDSHPRVGMCGTWNWHIDSKLGPLYSSELPDDHTLLLRFLERGMNSFIHGSVMMRADLFRKVGGYRGSLVEDFDLWLRMSEITQLGMLTKIGYYYWHSSSGLSSGAHIRQQRLVKLIIRLHQERMRLGHEETNWDNEYEQIINAYISESNPDERKTFIHYAHSHHLIRLGRWDDAKAELIQASTGQGQYAKKAKRNLSFIWIAPAIAAVYRLLETREPQFYARTLATGTPLPEYIQKPGKQ